MKSAKRLRAAWDYEPDTPVCRNCSGYRKAAMRVHMPRDRALVGPICGKGGFPIQPGGCCDKWSCRKSGEKLGEMHDGR